MCHTIFWLITIWWSIFVRVEIQVQNRLCFLDISIFKVFFLSVIIIITCMTDIANTSQYQLHVQIFGASLNCLVKNFKIVECTYICEFLWRWKLASGTNDDVSDTKWAQLEPAERKDNRGDSHGLILLHMHTLLFKAFIAVESTTHWVACGTIRSI